MNVGFRYFTPARVLGRGSHLDGNDGSFLKEIQACLTAMFEHCRI